MGKQVWEYAVIDLPVGQLTATLQDRLNVLGEMGWELVEVSDTTRQVFLKREPPSFLCDWWRGRKINEPMEDD